MLLIGECRLADNEVTVQVSLPGDLIFTGQLPPLNLRDLVAGIAGDVLPSLTGMPALQLERRTFVWRTI